MKNIILLLFLLFSIVGFSQNEDGTSAYGDPVNLRAWDGSEWELIRVDAVTNSLQVVGYEHHEIHSGSHYFIKGAVELGSGDSIAFAVTTPNTTTWTHMVFSVSTSAQLDMYVIEGVTPSGGDAITAYNNNRNSTNTSSLTIASGVTATFSGADTLEVSYFGSGSNPSNSAPGTGGRENELILKQNTSYVFIMKSGAASNRVDYHASWYEHINK